MHEVFKIESLKPIPKISTITHQFLKNPKSFQKSQNLGFKTWKNEKNERLETYQVKRKTLKTLENHLEKWFGVKESDLGGEEIEVSREMKAESHRTFI